MFSIQIATEYIILAQAVLALMIMSVMHHYSRVYRQQYLRFWSYSFLMLALFLCFAYLAPVLRQSDALNHPAIVLLNVMLMTSAGFLQVLFLLLGARNLVSGQPTQKVHLTITMAAMVAFSILISLVGAFDPEASNLRYLMRIGVRYMAAGFAFLIAVWMMMRITHGNSTGKRIVMIFFALYGVEMTFVGALNLQYYITGSSPYLLDTVRYHGLFELLVYPMIGVGLVIWLLETERSRVHQTERKLSFLDKTDKLTGIANRAGLKHALMRWQANADDSDTLHFVLFGVDRFNRINSSDGLRRGDEVLVNLARRFSILCASNRFIGRLNSDIFVALIDTTNPDDLSLIERQLKSMSRPIRIGTMVYHMAYSAGVTVVDSVGDFEVATMESNMALQAAKKAGGHCVVAYRADMVTPEFSPIMIEHELRGAFSHDQFTLKFQPIWSLADRHIDCFESLVRWRHPEKGELKPDAFLPILIQLGLIQQLDLWVLNEACLNLKNWHKRGYRNIRLAINLSSESVQSDYFHQQFKETCDLHAIDPSCLILELTENSVMQNIEAGKVTLTRLHDLGACIAIDDFGTGYSSLNYLCAFPSDIIKFDRSFIAGLIGDDNRQELLRALVPLCQKLNKHVVLEGIEKPDQHAIAEQLEINLVQGYLYGHPVTARNALAMLKENEALLA